MALGDQHLWVNKLNQPLQSTLRIRIQASDVSLVLQPPQQTSIRNVLRAKVANCYDDNGQVEVQLEIGGRNAVGANKPVGQGMSLNIKAWPVAFTRR
ncbi:molybdenum transport ATP-binding protein ModC [Salmonella enterica subsp. enterica serovar Daytona]|uniref:Molybdenum transport ATP-binding protein ModC n=1 Tax=Salmonella enterica subsp. enterica serovar Daytona TaxID=1962639 RepID=A0A447JKW1_SALET|nr:molybdenum transport ATP-binding protein ModC [Salmonella enterica subsp. enterica serovar Daytona]